LSARPFQASLLCFEVGGILGQLGAKLGDTVTPFDFTTFYAGLGATAPGDASLLAFNSQGILTAPSVGASTLAALRAEPRRSALDRAVNLRQNAYFAKFANSLSVATTANNLYGAGPTGKPARLQNLRTLAQQQADQLAGNQISSIVLASATIFGLVYAVFRSFRFAMLVMIPNVTPVILFFGLLGLGIAPLSLPTSMIGCSVLGVAVDDTIHSLVSYRRLRDGGATPEHAVLVTMREVGRPMVISSLMLFAGFLTITVSGFATIREFGWLSALTMVICLAADLVMLPALLVRARA
jgi:predicted exporter